MQKLLLTFTASLLLLSGSSPAAVISGDQPNLVEVEFSHITHSENTKRIQSVKSPKILMIEGRTGWVRIGDRQYTVFVDQESGGSVGVKLSYYQKRLAQENGKLIASTSMNIRSGSAVTVNAGREEFRLTARVRKMPKWLDQDPYRWAGWDRIPDSASIATSRYGRTGWLSNLWPYQWVVEDQPAASTRGLMRDLK